jgi:DNA-binding transcriptional MerR regulator/effector-binding domain-containing protein
MGDGHPLEGSAVSGRDKLLGMGAFARRSRLSHKALRLYAQHGLLEPAVIDEVTGYRRYGEEQLRDARLVRMMRRLDMPIVRVAELLAARREEQAAMLQSYWRETEDRVQRQRALAEHLLSSLSGGKGSYEMFEVQVRDAPEQTVLTEQRHVTVDALSEFIQAAGTRHLVASESIGGPSGAAFIVYHGDVSEDSDGPVEVCLPVDETRADTLSAPIRVEPAHSEAFVTVTKAQIRYPDILSAYDAVESWIAQQGKTATGSPREIVFKDMMNSEIDEPVADIAFPISR